MNDFQDDIKNTRRINTRRLCILMMIADRDIDDQEIAKITQIIESDSMFAINEDEIIALISDVSSERYNSNLEMLVDKYASGIKNINHQKKIIIYLEEVMDANGVRHEAELRLMSHIKNLWNI
tara:strand:+ start:4689 stop:5057 length:369 start_codon:yes stop_codon:yes gene_type:complete